MLTNENASALVGGPMAKQQKQQPTKRVVVEKGFLYNRQKMTIGQTVTLPAIFAGEVVASQKARWADDDLPAPPPAPVDHNAARRASTRFGESGKPPR